MERFDLDANRAFAYLRRVSNHSNRKLIATATPLVRTRGLPSGFGRPGDGVG